MLRISEFVLRQDYTIVIAKEQGTKKYKGVCIRDDSSLYELPKEELRFFVYLPNINEFLEQGSTMVSSMNGHSFHTEIGIMAQEENTIHFIPQATTEKLSYCESLIDLEIELEERKLGESNNCRTSQYKK